MGSLIGSPANLLLIGALDLYNVPGREQISFLNWFFWSVPLVIIFTTVAWALIITFGVSKAMHGVTAPVDNMNGPLRLSPDQKRGGQLFLFFVAFWILEGILKGLWPLFNDLEPYVCGGFFVYFVYLTFVKPSGIQRAPLLRLQDMINGLPKRGLLFLAVVIVLIPTIRGFQWDRHAASLFSELMHPETSPFFVFLGTTLGVIFLTEFFSNTVVSTAFFSIAYFTAPAYGMASLILMIAVSVASTCAFMTPIATPCNALAFGEMKKTSLGSMLLFGLPLNVAGALLITLWLQFVIPLVYL
jgi:sodium-dependent dicarboxylate transporter 2/3/5